MTRPAHQTSDREEDRLIPSFSAPDGVEGDVKDKVYQTAGIAFKDFAKNVFT